MAINYATGNAATVSFGGAIGNLISISSAVLEREAVEASTLASADFMEKIPSGVIEPGEVEIEFYYSGSVPDIKGDAATLSISIPPTTSGGSAQTLAGTAFCTAAGYPEAVRDEIMTATATFTWDGDTPPALT
jgi:hypothetical protein